MGRESQTCAFLLSDFMVAMNILESETIRLHYLQRLYAFRHRKKFVGDEIDFLAIYMKTQLSNDIPQGAIYLGIGNPHPIDEYFLKTYEGTPCSKPEFPLNTRGRGIIEWIDNMENKVGWTMLAQPLLDVSYKEQNKIESKLKKLAAKVRTGKETMMTLLFKNGRKDPNTSIIFVVHQQPDPSVRENALATFESAFASNFDSSQNDIVIGVGLNAFNLKHPYTFLMALNNWPLISEEKPSDK